MILDIMPAEKRRVPALSVPGKVLIVTKEEALLAFESRICSEQGFDVIQSRNGEQAFALFRQYGPVALVVTDLLYDWSDWRLAMRGDGKTIKNGIQLAAAIRKVRRHQNFVIQTYAAVEPIKKHLTRELAGVEMLHKPFRPEQLVAFLKAGEVSRAV
jgi:DNA-binding response OmpR family regulator